MRRRRRKSELLLRAVDTQRLLPFLTSLAAARPRSQEEIHDAVTAQLRVSLREMAQAHQAEHEMHEAEHQTARSALRDERVERYAREERSLRQGLHALEVATTAALEAAAAAAHAAASTARSAAHGCAVAELTASLAAIRSNRIVAVAIALDNERMDAHRRALAAAGASAMSEMGEAMDAVRFGALVEAAEGARRTRIAAGTKRRTQALRAERAAAHAALHAAQAEELAAVQQASVEAAVRLLRAVHSACRAAAQQRRAAAQYALDAELAAENSWLNAVQQRETRVLLRRLDDDAHQAIREARRTISQRSIKDVTVRVQIATCAAIEPLRAALASMEQDSEQEGGVSTIEARAGATPRRDALLLRELEEVADGCATNLAIELTVLRKEESELVETVLRVQTADRELMALSEDALQQWESAGRSRRRSKRR